MGGWIVLGAAVAGIDIGAVVTGRRTLSRAFKDGHSGHPWLLAAGTAYLLAHLYGALPRAADPLARFGAR